ncbi:alpha/beta fold hydrolase [Rubripirellula tenax]|nr:alpha/beta fold hydrolase [Rubripirellula tenax]
MSRNFGFLVLALTVAVATADDGPSDWSHQVELPTGETAIELFNGHDLTGWKGLKKYFSVVDQSIRAANDEPVSHGTYLFSDQAFREFRLLLEVKQNRSKGYSIMHSAVAALGERFTDPGSEFAFKGPLLMFCHDWGIWGAYTRGRIFPSDQKGPMMEVPWEKDGEWNQIEILVVGNRIRMVANGTVVIDHTETKDELKKCPIALQLHNNKEPQEFHFRGLVAVENPADELLTVKKDDIGVSTVVPSNVVIVHGAWGGAHHWKAVADSLSHDRAMDVRRITLTGLGERSHLASRDVDLPTHIQDVVNAIEFDDLSNVVMIGHSYGGVVVSGVVDAIPERISRVIYMDAHLLDDGESYLTHHTELKEKLVDRADQDGEGWQLPVDWANPMRDTPHPLATLLQPIHLQNPDGAKVQSSYWLFTDGGKPEADERHFYYQRAQQRGWPVKTFSWDHNPHRSRPDDVVAELAKLLKDPT